MKKDYVILIDNFDSFTYNLVNALQMLDLEVVVYRNDVSTGFLLERIRERQDGGWPVRLVLSPGPSSPEEAGNLMAMVELAMRERLPVLGICLGHQALGLALGGRIARCPELFHGRVSPVWHHQNLCFEGLPNPVSVARYHSLHVEGLDPRYVIATYHDICMALYSAEQRLMGLQFHVESIMTTYGQQILSQALRCL